MVNGGKYQARSLPVNGEMGAIGRAAVERAALGPRDRATTTNRGGNPAMERSKLAIQAQSILTASEELEADWQGRRSGDPVHGGLMSRLTMEGGPHWGAICIQMSRVEPQQGQCGRDGSSSGPEPRAGVGSGRLLDRGGFSGSMASSDWPSSSLHRPTFE